jgi:esterase/lipase
MKKQAVEFKIGEETLRGNFYIPDAKLPPAVIIFHGSGSTGESLIPLAEKLAQNGIFAFHFNFRGCGKSDGNFLDQTIGDALLDARTALGLLLEQKIDKDRIGICGSSFGGDISTLLLPEFAIKSLVLKAPAALNFPLNAKIAIEGGLKKEWEYLSDIKNWRDAVNFENIKKFTGDLLIIKAEKDDNVPAEMVDTFYSKAEKAYKKILIIKDADHRLSKPKWIAEATDLALTWFVNTL